MPGIARSVTAWGAAGVLSDPTGQLREGMRNLIDDPPPPLQGFRDYLVATYGEFNARAMCQSLVDAITTIIEQRSGDISLSKAGNIRCPVLLISGEHDFFAPPTLAAQLAARIPGAKAMEVQDVGHDVHNARPEWFVQTVVDWLNAQRASNPVRATSASE